jgi:hypothetical protein
MVSQLPIHLLDPTGASVGLTTPRYDPTSGRVIWTAPGTGGGGGGGRTVLSKQVLAADTAQISFTAIPGTYEHLQLLLRTRSTGSSGASAQDYLKVALNGDATLTNYASRILFAAGSVNNLASNYAAMVPGSGAVAGSAGELDMLLPSYSGTTWPKVMRSQFGWRFSATVPSVGDSFCEWAGTAAINAIALTLGSGGNFVAGSVAYLYGVS